MHHDRRGDAEREQTRGSQRPTGESDGAARCDLAVFALSEQRARRVEVAGRGSQLITDKIKPAGQSYGACATGPPVLACGSPV